MPWMTGHLPEARTFRARIFIEEGMTGNVEVIEYEGGLWIVTGWLEHNSEPARRPIRLIRLPESDLEKGDPRDADYLLRKPIPKVVFEGPAEQAAQAGFEVIHLPEIAFAIPRKH